MQQTNEDWAIHGLKYSTNAGECKTLISLFVILFRKTLRLRSMTENKESLLVILAAAASTLQADAIIGACFGAAFFLMMPFIESALKRIGMAVFSVGCGYSVGIANNPPHIMWTAILGSALAVVVLTAVVAYFEDVKLSEIITKAIEIMRALK